MKKLMRNKTFTLIVAIVLASLGVLMILDGFGVGGLYVGRRILRPLSGALLLVYAALALLPYVLREKGAIRMAGIAELAVAILLGMVQLLSEWLPVPHLSDLSVCALLGIVLSMRGMVTAVSAFLKNVQNPVPLWRYIVSLVMIFFGATQLAAPIISDRFVLILLGALMLVATIWFVGCTVKSGAKKTEDASLPVPVQKGEN